MIGDRGQRARGVGGMGTGCGGTEGPRAHWDDAQSMCRRYCCIEGGDCEQVSSIAPVLRAGIWPWEKLSASQNSPEPQDVAFVPHQAD